MSDLTITPQRWHDKRVVTVNGAAWRCQVCGWLGEHHYGVDSAQREGMRHFAERHPEIGGPVEVEWLPTPQEET